MISKNDWLIALTAALPISELRGAIPLGLFLGEPLWRVFLIAVIGNLLPIIPIYFLLEPVSNRLRKIPVFERFFAWLFERTRRKSDLIEKYEFWGLLIFVGIPLPMTGAWTGCMAASLLKMRFKTAFWSVAGGVLMAAAIVTALSVSGIIVCKGLK